MENPTIKLYISCHKPAFLPNEKYFYPIQAGAALAEERLPDMLRDDTGDNISDRNRHYCELTAQYWAWKNDTADYVGICHYRRYFSFAPERLYGQDTEIVRAYLNHNTISVLHLNDPEQIQKVVCGADVLLTEPMCFDPAEMSDLYTQFGEFSQDLHLHDLQTAVTVLKELHPEYSDAADAYLGGTQLYPCNMFIMKRPIFERYCAWLFPILEETERRMDYTGYSAYAMRTIGHIGERLLGVFCTYLRQNEPDCRIGYLQRVYFDKTDFMPVDALRYVVKMCLHPLFPKRVSAPAAPDISVIDALKGFFPKQRGKK